MKCAVCIQDLTFSYPDGVQALNEINLSIIEGENVGVVGQNGAGKSTLLLHLNGILRGKGRVSVFDVDVGDKTLKLVRRKVGLVFQEPDDQLFSPTVFDDVAFGPLSMGLAEDEVRARVSRALESTGMTMMAERAPHHLSGGQKKRVAISTVLALEPELLVFDEPAANLDPRSRHALIELLRSLPQTKVIASHDLDLIKALCQRTVVMDQGRIVADGATEHIMSDHDLLTRHGLATNSLAPRT